MEGGFKRVVTFEPSTRSSQVDRPVLPAAQTTCAMAPRKSARGLHASATWPSSTTTRGGARNTSFHRLKRRAFASVVRPTVVA
jgi:hypothetical protein